MKKDKYEKYKSEHKREKNKIRKLEKYMHKNPNDKEVLKHIDKIKSTLKT
jgi:histidyl-tRNA synthetase